MQNELILRYLCAFLIILIIFLLALWRVAIDEKAHYKSQSETNSESLTKLTHEFQLLSSKLEKLLNIQ